jgi:hypothetical protein
MEQITQDRQSKQRKNGWLILVGIFLIPIMILVGLNFAGFCFQKMKFISTDEQIVRIDAIVSYLAEQGMAQRLDTKDSSEPVFNSNDINKITKSVYAFFKNNPNNTVIKRYKILDTSEAYSSYTVYFFTSEEFEHINKKLVNSNNSLTNTKAIVGISYWQSYSSCGHPTFGMQNVIYEGDEDDLKFNPYKNNN